MSPSQVYLSLHQRYLQELSECAVQQLSQASGAQARAQVLQDFLAALYCHEDKLRLLQEAGVLEIHLLQMSSLVPVQHFLKEYLGYVNHSSLLSITCTALQPFSAKALDCPVFNYIVDKIMALQDREARNQQHLLITRLMNMKRIFGGPPPPAGGRLGKQFASLIVQYISFVASKRYSVSLVECSPEDLPARVVEWLRDIYTAAIRNFEDKEIALLVVHESAKNLFHVQVANKSYFDDVVQRAVEFYVASLKQLDDHKRSRPPPTTPSPCSIFSLKGSFFPCEIFKSFGENLLQPERKVGRLSQMLTKYLEAEISFLRVHNSPAKEGVPLEYMTPLLDRLQETDDCGVLSCLEALLSILQKEKDLPDALQDQLTTVANLALKRLQALWVDEATMPLFLDEKKQELRVTHFVQKIVIIYHDSDDGSLRQDTTLPNLQKIIYRLVYDGFVSYLQRLAGQQESMEKETMLMKQNLLLLNTRM